MYKSFFKRVFDFAAALIGIVMLSPFFVIIFISLSLSNNGKPFFFQVRPGKNEKLFRIVKFRTMNNKKDGNGNLLPDHLRLTKFGSFVRKTSLDEIPQLLNVLSGSMSLIGPRPLLPQYIPLYDEAQKRRHEVRPGITGWAQINGRNAISWKQKFEYDIWYIDHLSLEIDIRILFLTVKKVFISEGISQQGQATAEAFDGKN